MESSVAIHKTHHKDGPPNADRADDRNPFSTIFICDFP